MEALEDHSIVLQSHLVVGAAFEIVEDEIRRAFAGEEAVVLNVEKRQRGPELIARQRPQTQHAVSLRQGDEIDAGNDQAGHTPHVQLAGEPGG